MNPRFTSLPFTRRSSVKNKARPIRIVMSIDGPHFISPASGPSEFNVIPVAAHIPLPMKPAQIEGQRWVMTSEIEVAIFDESELSHLTSHSLHRDPGRQMKLPIVSGFALIVLKVIEAAIKDRGYFVKYGLHLRVTRSFHTGFTSERSFRTRQRLGKPYPLFDQPIELPASHCHMEYGDVSPLSKLCVGSALQKPRSLSLRVWTHFSSLSNGCRRPSITGSPRLRVGCPCRPDSRRLVWQPEYQRAADASPSARHHLR